MGNETKKNNKILKWKVRRTNSKYEKTKYQADKEVSQGAT